MRDVAVFLKIADYIIPVLRFIKDFAHFARRGGISRNCRLHDTRVAFLKHFVDFLKGLAHEHIAADVSDCARGNVCGIVASGFSLGGGKVAR